MHRISRTRFSYKACCSYILSIERSTRCTFFPRLTGFLVVLSVGVVFFPEKVIRLRFLHLLYLHILSLQLARFSAKLWIV